ncbi:alpha-glucosidase [Collybia nuda]|uniref:Alpha-glucosidase n=1 Tax=Collybia nuda TaxID=64659 RepID=A0A9P5Y4J5_9AGAR|nr:alpha-glucosidase [Collybia nuda]
MADTRAWWKEAVVYQIYPVSFFDSNGDGIGDLNGIYAKLDYHKDLGVDVLWLSPIYRSPHADMGYDISDYRDIDPQYGTLADWDNLLKGVYDRGMKLIMDLVVNHSSDEHEGFQQSRSSKDHPKRDWYIWRPPKYDAAGNRQPPNNWRSLFEGSSWQYDEKTGEYYLHLFLFKQPDLNWDNPDVRQAVWDLMKFWIDRGCDGFRMDVINLISKAEGLPDAPITEPDQPFQPATLLFANGPRVHEYIKEMNKEVLSGHDLITVGETPFTRDASELAAYVLPHNQELNMVFNFELMDLDSPGLGKEYIYREWKLSGFRDIICQWQSYRRSEGFWNATYVENHDHARAVSRFGIIQINGAHQLGLKNFPRSWGIEEYKDVASQNYWNNRAGGQSGCGHVGHSRCIVKKARDHARVPMQWESTDQAGFTSGKPWMRVNEDYKDWNATNQIKSESSELAFWKRALRIRKANNVLIYGDFVDISAGHKQIFAYMRSLEKTTALIILNSSKEEASFVLDEKQAWTGFNLALCNEASLRKTVSDVRLKAEDGPVLIKGFEGRLYIRSP